jgi:hypothetical protein
MSRFPRSHILAARAKGSLRSTGHDFRYLLIGIGAIRMAGGTRTALANKAPGDGVTQTVVVRIRTAITAICQAARPPAVTAH